MNWFIPDEIFNSCTDSMAGMFTCPEIERMCMLHMLRAHKILGSFIGNNITRNFVMYNPVSKIFSCIFEIFTRKGKTIFYRRMSLL